MHPSSTFHPPFIIKKLILSKRGGQREDERMIFSISHPLVLCKQNTGHGVAAGCRAKMIFFFF
jgi:hypothetical protein